MVFSSSTFLFLFLPIFLILYYAVPFKVKNIVLCIFSLIFYAWGEPVYIVLMVFSSIVDFCNGLCMEKFRNHKGIFLVISIIVNLSMLGFFKYSNLLVTTFDQITGLNVKAPGVALPIGISFYTFQTMSYSIDVYRGKVKTEHHFLDFMAYVSMFPQLIAGPIVRYSLVNEELHNRVIDFDSYTKGMMRFLTGLFKKVIVANSVGAVFNQISASDIGTQSGLTLWIGILAFSLQIYFDFSGYSDMAIGIGRMIGFTFPENFNYPYIALSVSDFWRRWHMSLTTWFRDYVYFPLGGSHKGLKRNILNICIVWALTGIWHGAAWNFMLWGLYFALILMLEKFVLNKVLEKIPKVIRHIYVWIIAMIGWCIFSFEKLTEIGSYVGGMFNFGHFVDDKSLFMFSQYKVILIGAIVLSTPIAPFVKKKVEATNNKTVVNVFEGIVAVGYVLLLILSIAMIISDTYNPFLYFRF
ncbi:MAG: MBOAT family protein [Lachnospiraceae bacterium]|nr:MBOAT family protein [Lachnospiraceae bacterium]